MCSAARAWPARARSQRAIPGRASREIQRHVEQIDCRRADERGDEVFFGAL
jgi:hypothetical protein